MPAGCSDSNRWDSQADGWRNPGVARSVRSLAILLMLRGGTCAESFRAFGRLLASGTSGNRLLSRAMWEKRSGVPALLRGTCTGIDFGASNGKPYWKFLRINMDGRNMSCGASTVYLMSVGLTAIGTVATRPQCKDASNNGGGHRALSPSLGQRDAHYQCPYA